MREAIVRRGSRIRKTIGRVASPASSGNASPTWNVISLTTSPRPSPRPPRSATASGASSSSAARSTPAPSYHVGSNGSCAYQPTAGWFQRIRETAVEAVRGGPIST